MNNQTEKNQTPRNVTESDEQTAPQKIVPVSDDQKTRDAERAEKNIKSEEERQAE